MTDKLTVEQIIQEVNSRPYSQGFRTAFMQSKLMPHEFILRELNGLFLSMVKEQKAISQVVEEEDQEFILAEIDRLSTMHYNKFEKVAGPKYLEFVHTCQQQWKNKDFSPAAHSFATNVLGMLRSIDKMHSINSGGK